MTRGTDHQTQCRKGPAVKLALAKTLSSRLLETASELAAAISESGLSADPQIDEAYEIASLLGNFADASSIVSRMDSWVMLSRLAGDLLDNISADLALLSGDTLRDDGPVDTYSLLDTAFSAAESDGLGIVEKIPGGRVFRFASSDGTEI